MNLERWCCSIYLLTVIALPVQSFQIPLLRRFLPFSSDDLNTRLWDDKQDYWSRYFMVNEAPFLSSNFVTEYIKRNTNHWSRSFNFPDRLYIDFNSRSQQASRSCSIWSNLFLSSVSSVPTIVTSWISYPASSTLQCPQSSWKSLFTTTSAVGRI